METSAYVPHLLSIMPGHHSRAMTQGTLVELGQQLHVILEFHSVDGNQERRYLHVHTDCSIATNVFSFK